jgi:hypothetical protein
VVDRYCMCKRSRETVDILLLHCKVVRDLWVLVSSLEIEWVMVQCVVELLACWKGQFRSHYNLEVWKLIPLCLIRCILRKHNT